ncbi:MAG TPA: GIY-YIG nuclease family protein [Dongiaceae bacterium]|nr:GIY-YIG nuclease family protein [Dongiaceae bacterium]
MARDGSFYSYIMASESGVLYVGVTNNLAVRVGQHKEKLVLGFTSQYNVTKLVWYEPHSEAGAAIVREKEIKGWRRSKKVRLIEERNPTWHDLSLGPPPSPSRHCERSLRSEESLLGSEGKREPSLHSE